MPLDSEGLAALLAALEEARALDPDDPRYLAIERASAHLAKTAKKKRRLQRSQRSAARDRALLQGAGIVLDQRGGEGAALEEALLNRHRLCYVCKRPYRELHGWYHLLCPECGLHSLAMRDQPLDLRDRRALVTGGRVKIGRAVALKMLHAGATVHVTTRYPRDATRSYAAEPGSSAWSSRLHVHGLDFRDLTGLLSAIERLRAGPAFDILVNNAAQSMAPPLESVLALQEGERSERDPSEALPALVREVTSLVSPAGSDLGAIDRERVDSWMMRLGEVSARDMVEVTVVNAVAPFLIVSALRDNLARSGHADRYIVNVTAVEGQFARQDKSIRHPHTNMAKAALNMMTRTSASDLASQGIYMVSVDPGWMSRESAPEETPPLDARDSAARILHPIAQGIAGEPLHGVLLKDFKIVPW